MAHSLAPRGSVELAWLCTAAAPGIKQARPWARIEVVLPGEKLVGSAPASFYLLVNLRGTRMLVEKRYSSALEQDKLAAAVNEQSIASALSAVRQTAILRTVPAREMSSASGVDAPRGIQIFSEFAPGGSLSDWVAKAAKQCGLTGRAAVFGAIKLDDEAVRTEPLIETLLSAQQVQK